VTDAMRRQLALRELESLTAKPTLAENAKALLAGGLTNEAELRRIFGFAHA